MSPHFHWPHLHWHRRIARRDAGVAMPMVLGVVALSLLAGAAQVFVAPDARSRDPLMARAPAAETAIPATDQAVVVPAILVEVPQASVEAIAL